MIIDFDDLKPLGSTGERIPAIGIGTWDIRDYILAEDALVHAIEIGLGMIDTAEIYGDGLAEELVGRVIKRVGRENVFITTKLKPQHFISKYTVFRAIEKSLARLGISTVDLVLVHWPEYIIPIKNYIKYLEALVDNGYTRYIGVSNFSLEDLALALTYLKKHDIVVNQVKYSVLDKSVEKGLLPYMIDMKITMQAYTPLERGAIAGNKHLIELGKKYGKTPVQIGLNYLISHKMVVAVPKTERRERVDEFKGAMGWRLSIDDIKYLRDI